MPDYGTLQQSTQLCYQPVISYLVIWLNSLLSDETTEKMKKMTRDSEKNQIVFNYYLKQ